MKASIAEEIGKNHGGKVTRKTYKAIVGKLKERHGQKKRPAREAQQHLRRAIAIDSFLQTFEDSIDAAEMFIRNSEKPSFAQADMRMAIEDALRQSGGIRATNGRA